MNMDDVEYKLQLLKWNNKSIIEMNASHGY
jgi:hypothetical protein